MAEVKIYLKLKKAPNTFEVYLSSTRVSHSKGSRRKAVLY